jgi:hypothetical protein
MANQPKTLVTFEGLGHNDLGNPVVLAAVFEFLDELD